MALNLRPSHGAASERSRIDHARYPKKNKRLALEKGLQFQELLMKAPNGHVARGQMSDAVHHCTCARSLFWFNCSGSNNRRLEWLAARNELCYLKRVTPKVSLEVNNY